MSTISEITVTNNATVDVAPVASVAVKKSFPAKYLKVLSIGLYVLKKMHPDVYVDKFVEHMKMGDSIESIMSEIDENVFAAATHLENEVRQIKRDLGKKPKKAKKSRVAKSAKVETESTTTEQIVELANEPTIVRGGDEPAEPTVSQEPKKTKKSKKAAPVVTETVTEPVITAPVVETPVVETVTETVTAPVIVETPAPKAKVTKAKVPKVPKDAAAAVEPVKVKEELDVGEPKVADLSKESKKATKKAPKVAAPLPSEYTPSDELVEESEKE
jgi:hypothetical protein